MVDFSTNDLGEQRANQVKQAICVLENLAHGINPINQEPFGIQTIFQHGVIVRAMFLAVDSLKRESKRHPRPQSARIGKPWLESEDAQLTAEFKQALSVATIAGHHQRTSGAITVRLVRLGLIPKYGPNPLGEA